MFDVDTWQEIWDTIRANKLRTFLTGFAVSWGIMILVVLLGSGNGLSHGIEWQFRDWAFNSVFMFGGKTSVPYKGMGTGRSVQFTTRDYEEIKERTPGVENVSGRYRGLGTGTVSYRGESETYDVRGVHRELPMIQKLIMRRGRFFNELDQRDRRKVAVLGDKVVERLFNGREAVGEWISINGIPFRVVGVCAEPGGEGEMERLFVPISTAQRTFNGQDLVGSIMFTTGDATLTENQRIVDVVRKRLADRHKFDAGDVRALWVANNLEQFSQYQRLLLGIRIFVWVIGIGTLVAGIVGVSNVLTIAVRERTRELGIRKVVGATPASIVGLVLQEAVLITTFAGYTGLVAGVVLLEIFSHVVPHAEYFRDPQVDLGSAVTATLLLVVTGVVAGFFPARRAAAVRPVDALHEE